MKYLIVGLGNIGEEYRNTRHNIGFNVLDALAKASNLVFYRWPLRCNCHHVTQRTSTYLVEAFYIYEPEWQRCTLLDAEGKRSIGERVDNSR